MFDDPPAKPQSVGDLIGRSFRLYRSHFNLLFRTLMGPTIVAALGALGIQFYISRLMESTAVRNDPLPYAVIGVSIIVVMIAKWILTVRQLALVRMAAGFDHNYATAHIWLSKRKWRVLLLCFGIFGVSVLAVGVWTVELVFATQLAKGSAADTLLASVGILVAPLGIAASILLIVLISFITFAVFACEDQRVSTVINRGFSLTFGDFWRTIAFGLLLYATVAFITIPLSLPLVAASAFDMYQHGLNSSVEYDAYQMPLYLMVLSHVWESLINMLLWPVAFMAFGLFYHDLRLRQEGLDIRRALDVLERKSL